MSTLTTEPACRWTMAGGAIGRGGLFPSAVILSGRPERRLRAAGAMQAATVFDGCGRVFVADMAGWVQAFDAEGRSCWRRALDGAVSATPAVDVERRRLFVGTHRGVVAALGADDGTVLWQRPVPSAADPRILSDLLHLPRLDRVILSSWGGRYLSLDGATGEVVHEWDAGISPGAGASADAAENVYCARVLRGQGASLVRVSADGNETVLHQEPEGPRGSNRVSVLAAPVIDAARERVWFVANDGTRAVLLGWDIAAGRILHRRECDHTVTATPALAPDGSVWLADMAGALHRIALVPGDPTVHRHATGADYLLAGPVCDGAGRAFLGDPVGRVWCLEPGGRARILFEAPRSLQARPSFDARGDLHVPGGDGVVYVFRNTAVAPAGAPRRS